jgi:hypothetical protein
MTGSRVFNEQTRDIALPSHRWRVTIWDYTKVRFKPLIVPLFVKRLLRSDLWYSCSGIATWEKETLCRLAVALRVPAVVHWIGTDVLGVKSYMTKRPRLGRLTGRLSHWATAPWLVDELKQLGIEAELVPFASRKRKEYLNLNPPKWPERFTVLTSIPDDGFDFYGGDAVVRLARDFPAITFNVVRGTGGAVREKPPNLHFLRWVEDMFEIYKNCVVVVRMTKHDGLSGSIQEPLALGRYAVWTYPFPGALLARDYPEMHLHVSRLFQLYEKGLLEPNEDGRRYIRLNLNPDTLARHLESAMSACAGIHA